MSDYLWDGSGEPDPEIRHLETLLARFRSDRPAPMLPENMSPRVRPGLGLWRPWLAATAALAAVVTLALVLLRHPKPPPAAGPFWQVTSITGSPAIGAAPVRGTGRLVVGEQLETDNQSKATVDISSVGEVRVDPDTRLRLIQSSPARQLLALDRGTIRAMIWAPPGQFVVNTPSATAVDLGCAYTLHVGANGAGLIKVTFGWVGFRNDGRESFIPEGAVCATRSGIGPGTPYFEDAPKALRDALAAFDFGDPSQRQRALDIILGQARRSDALTLWHLLSRTSGAQRARVFDRLSKFVPPPAGVMREGILEGDKKMLDLWWNSLGYGSMSWWRNWERDWSNPGS